MYTPINQRFRNISSPRQTSTTSLMAKSGMNLRDLPQLLSPDFALFMQNYIMLTDGGLNKRSGLERLFDNGVLSPVTMAEYYTDDIIIYGQGADLKAYTISTDTHETIKTFAATGAFDGDRCGDYFFACNGSETMVRVYKKITYGTQTVNFTVGKTITGATSGATALILEDADSGASGTLVLGKINGTFQNGEIISDGTGSATTTSVVTWGTTATGAACSVIRLVGNRLVIGNINGPAPFATDPTLVMYSKLDTGANPPFSTWTTGTLADDPGQLGHRNSGTVKAIESLGQNIVVFCENGKWAFYINTLDSNGALRKVDVEVISRLDMGGARAAKNTAKGLFYVNPAGMWQLTSLGQPNIPFSDQEGNSSLLLGTDYFKDINLDNADIFYHPRYNTVFLTCAKDSSTNNWIICYNCENKSTSIFKGWNINRWLHDGKDTVYGFSSLIGRAWQCFKGNSDDGADIWTDYYQEIKAGDLEMRNKLYGAYFCGYLSPSTNINIAFDKYDTTGAIKTNVLNMTWQAQNSPLVSLGYGQAPWGNTPWGGDVDNNNVIESFDGAKCRISNFQRLRVRITCHDKLPHQINWMKLQTASKVPIRRRKLTINN